MRLDLLNPVAQKLERKSVSAARLSNLDGKVIGLLWNHRAGGDAALKRTEELLKARYPGLETRNYSGAIGGSIRYMTKDDLNRVARECTAVIGSTGD